MRFAEQSTVFIFRPRGVHLVYYNMYAYYILYVVHFRGDRFIFFLRVISSIFFLCTRRIRGSLSRAVLSSDVRIELQVRPKPPRP